MGGVRLQTDLQSLFVKSRPTGITTTPLAQEKETVTGGDQGTPELSKQRQHEQTFPKPQTTDLVQRLPSANMIALDLIGIEHMWCGIAGKEQPLHPPCHKASSKAPLPDASGVSRHSFGAQMQLFPFLLLLCAPELNLDPHRLF